MSKQNSSFTGLFDSLQRYKSDESKGILSGCEAELQELMRQIDIMVNAKKLEWDNQLHVLQLSLDKKKKEIGILKIEIGAKSQENENLKHQITAVDQSQRELINEYENKLSQLREEVNRLKRDHEKLQRKNQKHSVDIKEENDKLKADVYKRDLEIRQLKEQNEDTRMKIREWDSVARTCQERVRGLEAENVTLKEKNEMQQRHSEEIQDMLGQRKHTLENLEKSHQIEIIELEAQIVKLRDEKDELKKEIEKFQDVSDEHQEQEKEKVSEIAYLDGCLKHAQERIEIMEREHEKMLSEMNSKCDLVKRLKENQKWQKENVSNLEKSLYQKEGVIRDLQDVGALEESAIIKRLREELRICQTELSSKKETEHFLRAENERLNNSLETCETKFKKTNDDLLNENNQLISNSQDKIKALLSQNTKLKSDLQQVTESRNAEIDGMRSEIENLTADLHQRDQVVAAMSEKMKKLERELRMSHSEYDKGTADLHVAKAQLDALRLENRVLKEDKLDEELQDLDLNYSNRIFDAQFEKDMTKHSTAGSFANQSLINKQRITLKDNKGKRDLPEAQSPRHHSMGDVNHRTRYNSLNTSASEFGDLQGSSFGDLKNLSSDYERAGSNKASRRSSVTTGFLAEETRREKELEKLFDGRLNELRLNTKHIIDSDTPR